MTSFQPEAVPGQPPPPESVAPRESTSQAPTSVARLNDTIHDFVESWGSIWVEGEITAWNSRSAGVFGRLKDVSADSTISFRIWSSTRRRLPDSLAIGDHVIANVKADYFARAGEFSFTVAAMRHVGLGDQMERIERLRAQLRREGLFESARKRPIPFLPRVVGLITGANSDAEKDVLRNAELRWPQVRFRTEHVAVQGDRSVAEIIAALTALDADPDVDVIVIARGGGDPQTLLGFSDERLVRAVSAVGTPVISAIGHENDHPLLDEVADVRASTPTDAAKRVVPDVAEQRALIAGFRSRLGTRLTQTIAHNIDTLQQIRSRPVLRSPADFLDSRAHQVWLDVSRGRDILTRCLQTHTQHTATLRASLRALSPAATLARGYAIAHHNGTIVRDATSTPTGTPVVITVEHGSFAARSEGPINEHAEPVSPHSPTPANLAENRPRMEQ